MFYLGDGDGWLSTCNQRAFVPLYLIGALYMFLALAVICDDFFVPSLEVIIDKTHLPEDVAGATFMAAGGSAPELFTSLCGIMFSDSVDVGIGTIVGSAVFNVLFVIAICAFGTYFGPTDKTSLELTWYPFTRDVTFYSIGLALLIGFFSDSKIYLYEASILFVWYVFYCLFMIVNERFQAWIEGKVSKWKSKIQPKSSNAASPSPEVGAYEKNSDVKSTDEKKEATPTKTLTKAHSKDEHPDEHEEKGSTPDAKEKRSMSPAENGGEGGDDEDEEDDGPMDLSWPSDKKWYHKVLHVVSFPIKVLLMLTVPDVRRGVPDQESGKIDKEGERFWWWGHSLFFITFIMSILWIGVYSYFMVWWVERIGFLLDIESSIMGLTLLAAGTSIPDLITSYLVASKGFGDMALSSSIGSNLFDICVGLPIPWLIYLAIEASIKVTVDSTGLICYILMLFAMLIAVFICILVMQWRLNLFMGIAMMILYVVFLVFAILIGQDVMPCILD
ncbi:sodium/potassium/calcium exchanger 2-like isoform X2 [Convolutriloba macropyga]